MPVPPLLCFGFLGHSGLLGRCSGNFSSKDEDRTVDACSRAEVDLFPVLLCLVSASHHSRETKSLSRPPLMLIEPSLVCGEHWPSRSDLLSSVGGLKSKKKPRACVTAVVSAMGGVLTRLASCGQRLSVLAFLASIVGFRALWHS